MCGLLGCRQCVKGGNGGRVQIEGRHENNIRKIANTDKGIPPKFGKYTIEGKKQTYWYKNIHEVINNRLGLHLNSNPTFKYHSVDVIFGADHGQGSF